MGQFSSVTPLAFVAIRAVGQAPPDNRTAPLRSDSRRHPGTLLSLRHGSTSQQDLTGKSLSINIQLTEGAKSALASAEKATRMAKRFSREQIFNPLTRRFFHGLKKNLKPLDAAAQDLDRRLMRISDQLATATALQADKGASRLSLSSFSVSVTTERMDLAVTTNGQTTFVSLQRLEIRLDYFAVDISREEPLMQDPLVLDMDGNGVGTLPLEDGALFDLNGDGNPEQTAWISNGDAFLAYDRNGDGVINSGRELFGDQHGAPDGLAELGRFDQNGDGGIDAADDIYSALILAYGDGRVEHLADSGIMRINLDDATLDDRPMAGGRKIADFTFDYRLGRQGKGAEILLETRA